MKIRKQSRQKTEVISFRVPRRLAEIIDSYIKQSTYVTPSEFVRAAVSEKIKTDSPVLYQQIFQS